MKMIPRKIMDYLNLIINIRDIQIIKDIKENIEGIEIENQ